MNVIVPTFSVRCILREQLRIGPIEYKVGDIVTFPYGVALQGIAQGAISCMLEEEVAYKQAAIFMADYGADSWFPPNMQTIGKVARSTAAAEKEAKTAVIH